MNKDDFLRLTANFIEWLCDKEEKQDTALHHEWTAPNKGYRLVAPAPGENFHFDSLASAREQYFWDGLHFDDNATRLESLRDDLRSAIESDGSIAPVLAEILRWGGVYRYPRIREWVLGYDGPCLRRLQELLQEATHGQTPLDGLHERAQGPIADRLVVDSGLTKIYALLVDDFCMFDSRVACGLQTLLARYERENDLQLDPECRLPALSQRRRVQGMPRLRRTRSLERLLWNIKASWLMQAVLGAPPFEARHWTVRDMEASLFMYGYAPPQ